MYCELPKLIYSWLLLVGTVKCDGTCAQGEGSCDKPNDCLPGLECTDDICVAGK